MDTRGRRVMSEKQKAAIRARAARLSATFPAAQYGKVYMRRGSDFTREHFGLSRRQATPQQVENRRNTAYTGAGRYSFGRDIGKRFGAGVGKMFGQKKLGRELGGFVGKAEIGRAHV